MFLLCPNVQGPSAAPPCSCCACHSVLLHIYRQTRPLNHNVNVMDVDSDFYFEVCFSNLLLMLDCIQNLLFNIFNGLKNKHNWLLHGCLCCTLIKASGVYMSETTNPLRCAYLSFFIYGNYFYHHIVRATHSEWIIRPIFETEKRL